jgi:hypothetical protein
MTPTEQMKADGWIEHDGKGCPVHGDAEVSVMFADGETDQTYAGFWMAPFPGADNQWEWDCCPTDWIIAYRPEQPQ